MKLPLPKKMIAGLTLGCLALSLGGLAAAHDLPKDAEKPGIFSKGQMPSAAEMEAKFAAALNRLVSQGTITGDQSAKLLQFFKDKGAQRKNDFEKMKGMTEDERRAYLQQHPHKHDNMQAELAAAANLSQEQTKAVADALRPPKHTPKQMAEQVKNTLEQLVTQGTLTKEQSGKLLAFFQEKEKQHQADFEKVKNMTPEERHSFFQNKKEARPDMAKELQAAANLSKEQADAVAKALHPHHGKKPPRDETPKE